MNTRKITVAFVIAVIVVVLGGVMASSAWPPAQPPYDNCYALIVGISDYEGTEYDMSDSCVRDATELYWHLILYWQRSHNIRLRTNQGVTRSYLDNAFNTLFAGAGPNDLAIIYWAGHGGWVGSDFEPIDENGGYDGGLRTYHHEVGYTDDELAVRINAISAGTKVVILDSCHMGAFADELDLANTVVILSSEEEESAETYEFSDPMPAEHLALSYYFNRASDLNSNGLHSIEEAFAYAYPKTVANAIANGKSQHPILIDNVPGDVEYLGLG